VYCLHVDGERDCGGSSFQGYRYGFFADCGPLDEIMLASREMNVFEFQSAEVVTFNFWKDLSGNEIGVNVVIQLQIIGFKYIPKE
jgi:hypothetical protein